MIRKKWKSLLIATVMATTIVVGAGSSMAYAQEYVEGEATEVSLEDNQESGDFSEASVNQEESTSVAESQQSSDTIGDESQAATESADVQSDASLATAQGTESSWKDKLKETGFLPVSFFLK